MIQLLPPSNFDDFQNLICDLFNRIHNTATFHVIGRSGQSQWGGDIQCATRKIIIQCGVKGINRSDKLNKVDLIKKLNSDFQEAINHFGDKMEIFYLTSTFAGDNIIQECANNLALKTGLTIEYWGWDRISNYIIEHKTFFVSKYPQLVVKSDPFSTRYTKKQYKGILNYIYRTVTGLKSDPFNENTSLVDLLIKKKDTKIVLLSSAGLGKSIELQCLANYFSEDSSSYQPVYCKLNLYNGQIRELLDIEYSNWSSVNPSDLVLILDGLDEIIANKHNDFIIDIENIVKEYPEINIIISSRQNFYSVENESSEHATIRGFNSYYLNPIQSPHSYFYVYGEIGEDRALLFFEEARKRSIEDLLSNPFYLVNLVKIFKQNSFLSLPTSRSSILEKLIDLKIEEDINHFKRTKGEDIRDNTFLLKQSLQRIAVSQVSLGRNYVLNDEFQQLIPDSQQRALIKHLFLFNRKEGSNDIWEFEHNNFQEYLAAKLLANQKFEVIQKYTSFENGSKIKPYWINTITFLVGCLCNKDASKFELFIKWLIKTEPSLLVRTEFHNIDMKLRFDIFQLIFTDAKRKQIWLKREWFDLEELVEFSGKTDEVVDFLLNEVKLNDIFQSCYQAIILLSFIDNKPYYSEKVSKVLLPVLLSTTAKNNLKYETLIALANHKIDIGKIDDELLDKLNFEQSTYIQAGVFHYINKLSLHESHIKVILDGFGLDTIGLVRPSGGDFVNADENEEPYFASVDREWQDCISKIKTKLGIEAIMDFVISKRQNRLSRISELIESEFFANCVAVYSDDDFLVKLLSFVGIIYREIHTESIFESLLNFLKESHSLKKAFLICIKLSNEKYTYLKIAQHIADQDCIDMIFELYASDDLSNEEILNIRFLLCDKDAALHDKFQSMLLNDHGDRYKYEIIEDDYEIRISERTKRDIDLLFDKSEFFNELYNVFNKLQSDSLDRKMISSYDSEGIYGVILKNLLWHIENDIVQKGDFEYLKDNNWEDFVAVNLNNIIDNGYAQLLSEDHKQWIVDWCFHRKSKASFRTYGKTGKYCREDIVLVLFFLKFDLELGQEFELQMLCYDAFLSKDNKYSEKGISILFEKVVAKYGSNLVCTYLIKELDKGINYCDVYMNYFNHCKRLECSNLIKYVPTYIGLQQTDFFNKSNLIEAFQLFNGDYKEIEFLISELNFTEQWSGKIVSYFISNNSIVVIDKLNKALVSSTLTEPTKLKVATYLILAGQIDGLKYLATWMKVNKQCAEPKFIKEGILKMDKFETVDVLLQMLEVINDINYKERKFNYTVETIRETLYILSHNNEQLFVSVKDFTNNLIRKHNAKKHRHISFLHNFATELEKQFYLNKSQNRSIEEVLELNSHLI